MAAEFLRHRQRQKAFCRQVPVVFDRKRGIVVDGLGAGSKTLAAEFVDAGEDGQDLRPDAGRS
jgi:hypothetical protein